MGVEPGGGAVCEYRVRRADVSAGVGSHPPQRPSDPDRRVLAGISLEVTAAREAMSGGLKALGLVAGGLAHVLNNAMTVVLGNLELQAASPDTPDGSFWQHATAAARKAAAAATRLQAFAGGRFLRPRSVELAAFVSAHVADWQRALGPHIRFTVHTHARSVAGVSRSGRTRCRNTSPAGQRSAGSAGRSGDGGGAKCRRRRGRSGPPFCGGRVGGSERTPKTEPHDRGGPPTVRRAILHHPMCRPRVLGWG